MLGGGTADARPSGYTTASCDPGGTDVCTYDSVNDFWKCDLADITTGSSAATAWMIYGETDATSTDCGNICDGNPYCAWGIKDGVKFYCDLDEGAGAGDDMVEAWLIGTPGDDTLYFWYKEGTTQCKLSNAQIGVSKVVGKMIGDSGDDSLYGSPEDDDSIYIDRVYGDSGADTICTYAGADEIRAGSGNDDVHSGDGDDTVWGEDDADNITSGDGDDTVYAGDGVDQVCTDDGDNDQAYGGNDQDNLWDTSGTNDYANCGANNFDGAYSHTTRVSCEGTLSMRPPSCPSECSLY